MVNKKGVSLMVSYVILISIGIGLSILVYAWLSDYSNIFQPKIDCKEGTSLFLDDYNCPEGTINLSLKNNGYFNVSGFIISAGNNSNRAPIDLLNATGAGTEGFPLGHYYFIPALGPEKIGKAVFIGENDTKVIQIQPFILDKKGNKIMCEQAVIKQNIDCIEEEVPFDILSLPGFVSWWKFDENSGDLADDFIGNNDGTLTNMDDSDWVIGKSGNALSFDGNDYVDVGDIDFISGDFSISFWVKTAFDNPGPTSDGIITKNNGDGGYDTGFWISQGADNKLSFGVADGTTFNSVISSNVINDGIWHHVVGIYIFSNSNVSLYIDKTFIGSNNANPLGSIENNRIISIGCYVNLYCFNGTIDEAMIFNTALSEQNISDIYKYYG